MTAPSDASSELHAYDFELPESHVARRPTARRGDSRLLMLDRETGEIRHGAFLDFVEEVGADDLVVLNDSRVLAARLAARKADSGGHVELLLVEPTDDETNWRCMGRPAKSLRAGQTLLVGGADPVRLTVTANEGEGFLRVRLPMSGNLLARHYGSLPLPPYLGRPADSEDDDRYQTVMARHDVARSVAAPTAGLHFTEELLARLDARGVARAHLTLDVGPGTFLPVKAQSLEDHRMHAERFELPVATVEALQACRRRGGKVVAIGTTTTRVLESFDGLRPGPGSTQLFIRPGHRFRWVDQLITNFHLPRSTLVVLVSALAGRQKILSAYRAAIERGYRFYSYGDAMWIR